MHTCTHDELLLDYCSKNKDGFRFFFFLVGVLLPLKHLFMKKFIV